MAFLTPWPLAMVVEVAKQRQSILPVLRAWVKKAKEGNDALQKAWLMPKEHRVMPWSSVQEELRCLDGKVPSRSLADLSTDAKLHVVKAREEYFVNPDSFCVLS